MPLMRLTTLDGDAVLPLADAKRHLRMEEDDSFEDAEVKAYRDAAVAQVEWASGIILAPAEFRWTMTRLQGPVSLPVGPVTEIVEVVYHDGEGSEVSYADARLVDGAVWPGVGASWPHARGYAAIHFAAGHLSPDDAPNLIAAVRLLLGHFYLNREASTEKAMSDLPFGVQTLIGAYQPMLG